MQRQKEKIGFLFLANGCVTSLSIRTYHKYFQISRENFHARTFVFRNSFDSSSYDLRGNFECRDDPPNAFSSSFGCAIGASHAHIGINFMALASYLHVTPTQPNKSDDRAANLHCVHFVRRECALPFYLSKKKVGKEFVVVATCLGAYCLI